MSVFISRVRPPHRATARGALAFGLMVLVSPSARAQQTVTQATVSGRVEDASGAAVADAPVEARSLERGLAFSAATDAQGRYRFLYLPADTYEVRVDNPRFQPAVRRVALTVGQAVEVLFRLQLQGAEAIDVLAAAPP